MDAVMTGKWVLLIIAAIYLVIKIGKLPKGARNFVIVFMVIGFVALMIIGTYYPDKFIQLNEFLGNKV